MCTTNANCEAYYYEASNCYEAGASGLVGASENSPASRHVYADQDIYRSNKGQFILKLF